MVAAIPRFRSDNPKDLPKFLHRNTFHRRVLDSYYGYLQKAESVFWEVRLCGHWDTGCVAVKSNKVDGPRP